MRWLLLLVPLVTACSEAVKAPDRDWGRELVVEAVEAKAEETLEPSMLAQRPERFLGMSFEESRARLGPIRFEGEATLGVKRNGHELELVEKTRIVSGPEASVRIEQRDGDDYLTREGIRVGRQWYIRNGEGRLRKADFIHNERVTMLTEAYAALGLVARLLGERLRFEDQGPASVASIAARRFEIDGGAGEALRLAEHDLRVARVDGRVWIAEAGPPVRWDVELGFRTAKAGQEEDGRLSLSLKGRLQNVEPEPFEVAEAVEPLRALEADLNPLDFLEDLTRTSTVIGGD